MEPVERLKEILNDGEPYLIVTDHANEQLARKIAAERRVMIHPDAQNFEPSRSPEINIPPPSPAWLLYTSGTTGRPKGVIQTHRNIVHNVFRLCRGMNLNASDAVVLLNSPGGGQGLSTTWCPLLSGAGLFPFPTAERGVTGLKELLIDRQITIYVSSASVFRSFARTLRPGDVFPAIKTVRLGSEAATVDDFTACKRIFTGKFCLLNSLSTSETGNIAQRRFPHDWNPSGSRLPVGWPADGIEISLVNNKGEEIHDDGVGEIIVRSHYLSPGYWRNEKLTSARFSENKETGIREFRGGDLARRAPDGALIFVGRGDAQVKVHGYRVELQEIEAALLRQCEVESAAVSGRPLPNDEVELAAHVVLKAGHSSNPEKLRRELRNILPGYMVPARLTILDKLPLTAHGKIDYEKLREFNGAPPNQPAPTEATPTEALLAAICEKVFDRAVSAADDFFDLGGDSLKAAIISAEIYAALNVELELRAFNEHSKLSDLAAKIDMLQSARESDTAPSISRAPRDQPLPLSFRQEDIWSYSQTPDGMAGYAMASNHLVRGPLNADFLRESLSRLTRRHEILRTTFDEINGQLSQIIHPPSDMELPVFDCQHDPNPEAKAAEIVRAEGARLYDLKKLPLLRFALVRIREQEHWLLRYSHHILFDAWSWAVYFRELGVIYEAVARRTASPLPKFETLQYADYAAQKRRLFDSSTVAYQKEMEWWLRLHSDPAPPLALPFRRFWQSRNARPDDGILFWGINAETSRGLERVARSENATYYVARLAALLVLLSEDAPGRDVLLGAYVTGRNRMELQNMLGDFSNTVALRMQCDPDQTFRNWIGKVREHVGDAQERAEIPHERLRAEMTKRGVKPPDIRVVFNVWEHTMPVRFAGIEMRLQGRHVEGMPWGFCLTTDRYNETNGCRASFDARIYSPARVRKWVRRFARVLDNASENPDLPIGKILAASKSLRF
jgi:acyl-coenzyme A synthetase/AMP-(fatty) acid ligase/acyl carrier protein